jgi:hypothetical protein
MANSYQINYYGGNGNAMMQLEVGYAATFGLSNATVNSGSANTLALSDTLANTKGLVLTGRNYTSNTAIDGYGKVINQNYVRLTENFANTYTSHSNANLYPQFITGQLVFETDPAPTKTANTLYLFTSTGNYTTGNKIEILSNVNPPHKISWGSNVNPANVIESNVAIISQDGNVVIAVNGTPNVVTVASTGNSNSGNITLSIGTQFKYDYVNGGLGNVVSDRFYAANPSTGDMSATAAGFHGNGWNLFGMNGANITSNTEVFYANTANNVAGANVSGQVANANLAWRVYNNSQPNITSVGTLTSLTTSGAINSTLTGASPFNLASNSLVSNLNAELLGGFSGSKLAVVDTVVIRDSSGGVSANGITANTLSGSLTTGAQPNITSVGTLNGLTVGGSGIDGIIVTGNQPNITNLANVSFSGNVTVSGTITGTVAGNATSNVSGGNASFSTKVEAPTGNFTTTVESPSANITNVFVTTGSITTVNSTTVNSTTVNATTVVAPTVQSTTLTAGSSGTNGTITGNWTLSSGSKMQATYADLAEYYSSELDVTPGTVVEFGGAEEIQLCDTRNSTRVAGVVSTDPAFVMNEKLGQSVPRILVALIGRVPCKVYGTCAKGDMMVAAGGGYAMANNSPAIGSVIGKALEDKTTSGVGVIEVVVGRL